MYVYVASPYSDPDEHVRAARYRAVNRYIYEVMRKQADIMYFSPIVYFHPLAVLYGMPKAADYWASINTGVLRHANAMQILMIPGAAESHGVMDLELPIATTLNIPVEYVTPSKEVEKLARNV